MCREWNITEKDESLRMNRGERPRCSKSKLRNSASFIIFGFVCSYTSEGFGLFFEIYTHHVHRSKRIFFPVDTRLCAHNTAGRCPESLWWATDNQEAYKGRTTKFICLRIRKAVISVALGITKITQDRPPDGVSYTIIILKIVINTRNNERVK